MSKQGQVGVYKLYKLGRGTGGMFTTDFKNLERDVHVVHHDYAEKTNRFSELNGLMYEFCEKETKLYWEKKPFKQVVEYAKFEEVKEETKQDVSDSDVLDLDTLRLEYEDLTGKKANKLWKEDTLSEKIAELKK